MNYSAFYFKLYVFSLGSSGHEKEKRRNRKISNSFHVKRHPCGSSLKNMRNFFVCVLSFSFLFFSSFILPFLILIYLFNWHSFEIHNMADRKRYSLHISSFHVHRNVGRGSTCQFHVIPIFLCFSSLVP